MTASSIQPASPVIAGTAVALPPNRYTQHELVGVIRDLLPQLPVSTAALERFFDRVGVEERFFALPAEAYADLGGLEKRNAAFLSTAVDLGEQAIREALRDAHLSAAGISEIITNVTTGIAVPSLEARLMNRLEMPADARRVPLFGLGCAGGAAGVALLADYLTAYPDRAAALLTVELCSLTFQPADLSTSNAIGAALFGDAAAAVVMLGARHPLADNGAAPRVLASRSAFFRDTEHLMGWDVVDTGFKLVLSPDVPRLAGKELSRLVTELVSGAGLTPGDVDLWIPHAGGPKVIAAVTESLGVPAGALAEARKCLARIGNVSSASVLVVLDGIRRERRPVPGSYAVMFAFGPAFAAELVLLRW
ncbi:MAG TPA: 3-oxoacyl-[acyl-carrier-protein] synthase III C-terminal domain-containing protein [Kofleriaceae bacterium]|nr:3-oxoacyl-[acyl-carrier-protein] synthase III C-terminal domain-containing protein [Kofleriaceae bacterium]